MSKTRGNGIPLRASEDQTAAVIRRAPTDSDRHITYDPAGRPAIATLLELLAAATGNQPARLGRRDRATGRGARGAGHLKRMLAEAINELLRPLRTRRADLADDLSYLNQVLATGNQRARGTAEHTLAEVHNALGMTYANLSSTCPHKADEASPDRPTGATLD